MMEETKTDRKIAKLYAAISYVKRDRTKIKNKLSSAIKHCEELRRRNAELERELADIKASYRNILAEPCESDDRVHCTCVPALRSENERLRDALEEIENTWPLDGENAYLMRDIAKAALKEEPNAKDS